MTNGTNHHSQIHWIFQDRFGWRPQKSPEALGLCKGFAHWDKHWVSVNSHSNYIFFCHSGVSDEYCIKRWAHQTPISLLWWWMYSQTIYWLLLDLAWPRRWGSSLGMSPDLMKKSPMQVVEVTETFAGFELGSWRLTAIPLVFELSSKDLLQQLIRFVAIVRHGYNSLLLFMIIFFQLFKVCFFQGKP